MLEYAEKTGRGQDHWTEASTASSYSQLSFGPYLEAAEAQVLTRISAAQCLPAQKYFGESAREKGRTCRLASIALRTFIHEIVIGTEDKAFY